MKAGLVLAVLALLSGGATACLAQAPTIAGPEDFGSVQTPTGTDSVRMRRSPQLDMDVLDIFLLHEQESRLTLRGHREALEYYLNEREKGRIRAVGVSTHNIEVVRAICEMPEIDVVHPLGAVRESGRGA